MDCDVESEGMHYEGNCIRPSSEAYSILLQVTVGVLIRGIRMLSEMPVFQRTGGTHSAILFTKDGDPLFSAEDISRHNTVDKVIGGGLKMGTDLRESWLAVSGRLSTDMVLKPMLVGIPIVASV